MNVRKYPGIKANIPHLINELRNFFDNQDFEMQARHEATATIIQVRKTSPIRDWTGTSYALTIKIILSDTGTEASIGRQKWGNKIGIGFVAFIIALVSGGFLTPLLAVPAYGAYQQYKITEEAWNVIEKHMASESGGSFSVQSTICNNCGATNSTNAKFCSNCGLEL
jgi:hypothetical protein